MAALSGARPSRRELLLTPENAARLTRNLAQMRGAAMKLGQLLSMETGDLLPPELADILGNLRQNAHFMPPRQLGDVLARNWGPDYRRRLWRLDVRPMAAASIGQVHRGLSHDGADLAIKVQYPGVRDSIDADLDNVATLLRLSGLLPRELDIAPLMATARQQLHEEADYTREAEMMTRFAAHLRDDPRFALPTCHPDLSTRDILAMGFMPGVPIERLTDAPQALRDRVIADLTALTLDELFRFGLMQTDPNFANYLWDEASGRVVLLDFGATREIPAPLAQDLRMILRAAIDGDDADLRRATAHAALLPDQLLPHQEAAIAQIFALVRGPLGSDAPFDFADPGFMPALRRAGEALGPGRDFWHIPPPDMLFVQRKVAGLFLLAARLRARVALRPLMRAAL